MSSNGNGAARKARLSPNRRSLGTWILISSFFLLLPLQAANRLSVTLGWNPSEGDVAGYTVYYGTQSRNYTDFVHAGLNNSVTVPNLKANTTYYFVVVAYISIGIETPPSPEVSFQASPTAGDSYIGLFYEDSGVREPSAGFIRITVNAGGSYSARAQIRSARYAFSGRCDALLQGPKSLRGSGKGAPPLQLRLTPGIDPDEISGQVTDGSWVSSLSAFRSVHITPATGSPYARAYTLIIPGHTNDPAVPAGYSFGKVRSNRAGVASLAGALADGNRFTGSSAISARGAWPVYVVSNPGKDLVLGWVSFADQPDSDLSGTLTWIKPADTRALLYAGGFNTQSEVVGSIYTPPARGNPPINPVGVTADFSGGNLDAPFSEPLSFSGVALKGDGIAASFSLSTGTFKGIVADPATHRPQAFQGAVLQKQNVACGFLTRGNQSSAVIIGP